MSAKLGIPWDTNREENCECPCGTCLETIGYDPSTPCGHCPIDHEKEHPTTDYTPTRQHPHRARGIQPNGNPYTEEPA